MSVLLKAGFNFESGLFLRVAMATAVFEFDKTKPEPQSAQSFSQRRAKAFRRGLEAYFRARIFVHTRPR
jgi:hypothetical protein